MSQVQVSESITRKSASNLALAFVFLPRNKRQAMCALYAFCRQVDDVADNEDLPIDERRAELERWRQDIYKACHDGQPELPVITELHPYIKQFHLSYDHFEDLILGVERDLTVHRYQTWDDLETYCFHVASVVGLLSIEIFEYHHPSAKEYAYHLGQALQLTNILRDVRTDAEKGRIYIPLEALETHEVSEEDILQHKDSPAFRQLAQAVANKARQHYAKARNLIHPDERKFMVASELMGSVYWRILRKIEDSDFQVLQSSPIKLSKSHKIALIVRSALRHWTRAKTSDYG